MAPRHDLVSRGLIPESNPTANPAIPTANEQGQEEPGPVVEAEPIVKPEPKKEAAPKVEAKPKAAEASKPKTSEGPVKVHLDLPNPVEEDLFKIE